MELVHIIILPGFLFLSSDLSSSLDHVNVLLFVFSMRRSLFISISIVWINIGVSWNLCKLGSAVRRAD